MATPRSPRTMDIWVKIIVPIVVALIGGAGFWQYLESRKLAVECTIDVSDISVAKTNLKVNESVTVSIHTENPDGRILLYNWQAVNGRMAPGLRSPNSESIYTAPSTPMDDTISVDVILESCVPTRKSRQIVVTHSSILPSQSPVGEIP